MRLFSFGMFRRMWRITWLRWPLIVIGFACLFAAVWFGLPMTGQDWAQSVWLRAGLIALLVLPILVTMLIRWRRRRRAAAELEEQLVATPVGDGAVLAERMQETLAKLKKSGGSTYLYDLPWYVIIGPPGAGKTTALVHSGLEFPGTDKAAIAGFGGTKNCDFWFAEEAVMIDTAGRYTTQDSDVEADSLSWQAFLQTLKRARPNQPINGVILAFSCEDMMTATEESLEANALAVRARLAELNETLRISVPVYTIFTKADMISGFRDFFGTLPEDKRRAVWGTTFQTKDRTEETYRAVPEEFDKLIARLSDEVTDRMNEEPDTVARIAMFGFPGQLALLQRNVSDFLRRVFQKGHDTKAILRGFYFTSGTQEGTPIDQVLGAMSEETGAIQSGFMSGRGRSYFLHDLLKRVIFEERDWVGYDLRTMRRRAIARSALTSVIVAAVIAGFGIFGYSYWQNATLVREAALASDDYRARSQDLLAQVIITDPSTRPILDALAAARDMPAGWAFPREQTAIERVGLSRRESLRNAALQTYSDSLERLLRPRMMLHLENRLPTLLARGDIQEAYLALKVYILLAKQQSGREDDQAIQAYFARAWAPEYAEPGLDVAYGELNDHLEAMLELDARVQPRLLPNEALVERTQQQIATLSLAQQAYGSIVSDAAALRPFNLSEELEGVQADLVFRTSDGRPLNTLEVPALYTFTGYWSFFQDAMANAEQRLKDDAWVLGASAEKVDYSGQIAGLNRDLHAMYRSDFTRTWREMLARVELVPMAQGAPQYPALAVAAAPFASPILKLAEAVDRETRLSRFLDVVDGMELSPEALASGDIGGELAGVGFDEVERRSGAIQRIALGMLRDRAKFQERAGAGAAAAPSQRRQLESIEQRFEKWHRLVRDGDAGRPIDVLLKGLSELLKNRQLAGRGGTLALDERGMQDALNDMSQGMPFYPETIVGFVNQIESEFLTVSANASMEELQRALAEEVAAYCTQNVASAFPFAQRGARHISTSVFGEFFGFGGRMERFYDNYLREHTQREAGGAIVAREGSALGARLSSGMLSQFARAERIKQAFFPPDAASPQVSFTISQAAASQAVESSEVTFSGRTVQLFPNSSGSSFSWPDETADIAIALLPRAEAGEDSLRFGGGRWALSDFITRGRIRKNGTRADVTHQVGGRSVTFRLEFDSIEIPFLMRELSEFSCPKTIE
ncbi:type VI secretion system membrane subunit TssM [Sulfitobacter albidus]|uniref:Type VI secretion system membrane subunit TssM n=1 Tax=Sulfitobacter albidus TaxID=2829501 RepID=A0A975JHN3_9RHOB|nr:type VI secretion system membrane subunit TssM [Sulfitobacter albidus]QUJ78120.1 type VI secretion system membrane subunit TssM [Sulfitobacter albidus]